MTDPAPFSVSVAFAPPTVRVEGEIDISTSGALSQALSPLLEEPHREPVVFDLTRVTFMDSSGLAVLLHAAAAGRQVVVRGASALIRRVIDATGLTGVIVVEP